ncbi:MAG: hypothetical protein KAU03_04125, partial [Candidatus Altiarchaeales archaeon]|nr:hypothetical protein [Candidatus Altiarchaeales archaeon]
VEPAEGEVAEKPAEGEAKEELEITDDVVGDLKEVLDIIDELLEKLPDDVIDKFLESENYGVYEKLYDAIENYKGEDEQKEYINEKSKGVLMALDDLLEEVPPDIIDTFSKSANYNKYNRILSIFGL